MYRSQMTQRVFARPGRVRARLGKQARRRRNTALRVVRRGSRADQVRDEETVAPLDSGRNEQIAAGCDAGVAFRKRATPKLSVSGEERVDHLDAFARLGRANAVDQTAAGFHASRRGIEQLGLKRGETAAVVGRLTPARLRMPAEDAESGTRCVEQDCIAFGKVDATSVAFNDGRTGDAGSLEVLAQNFRLARFDFDA